MTPIFNNDPSASDSEYLGMLDDHASRAADGRTKCLGSPGEVRAGTPAIDRKQPA
jgi:hypothetical protein